MTPPPAAVISRDFGAAPHVEYDGVDLRSAMIPDVSDQAVHVTVTRAETRRFALDVPHMALKS